MAVPRGVLKSEYCLRENLIQPLLPHINFVTLSYYQFIIYFIIILYYYILILKIILNLPVTLIEMDKINYI